MSSLGIHDKPGGPAAWAEAEGDLLSRLRSTAGGLSPGEAERRLQQYGRNRLRRPVARGALRVFVAQFKSPLVLILVFAAAVSLATGDYLDASIVLAIIAASAVLSFTQEYRAGRAVEKLLARIRLRADVLRDGRTVEIDAEEVVPGDVVFLSAGSLIPADARVLQAHDFFVNQAVLTGETFPVEKHAGVVVAEANLAQRTNWVLHGTSVRSGTARALVVATGKATTYGQVAERLALRAPETEFERGIRQFGTLLTQLMTLLVLGIFAANVAYARPVADSLLFALALAVGMAPELLPAIISITLARGAQRMANAGVIVRRLAAIENFGSMDVLATDKTGTLTVGVVRLDDALDAQGSASPRVRELAWLNATLQTGLANPLDEAIAAGAAPPAAEEQEKVEEIPYDFVRRRLSIAVRRRGERTSEALLITKGALDPVLAICTEGRAGDAVAPLDEAQRQAIGARASAWADSGFRVLAVATRRMDRPPPYAAADEASMIFEGFLLFFDPPKPDAAETLASLRRLGVELKVITGDSHRVALHVARAVDLPVHGVLTGADIDHLHDEALWQRAERTTLFAEVDPNQKERIINALRRTGHVVGYLGDGINDAPSLHAADVGVSVDTAVDVAKETADIVLLEHSLSVLRDGIEEGRRVFANTMKYVYTTSSANFGNMLSAVPAAAAEADPAEQLPVRPAGDGHRRRPRRPRGDPAAAPLAGGAHTQLHARLRPDQFRLRCADVRPAAAGTARRAGGVPHRLVRRVAADRTGDPAGGAHAPAAAREPAKRRRAVDERRGGGRGGGPALPARRRTDLRLRPAVAVADGHAAGDHARLRAGERVGQAPLPAALRPVTGRGGRADTLPACPGSCFTSSAATHAAIRCAPPCR